MNHLNTSIVSLTLTVLLFAAIRLVQTQLPSENSKLAPFLGGFLGSNIFILLLTAISNLEMELFDDTYQARFFPEVTCCLFLAALAASAVHRISITLW
uniref:Dolichyl-diphosphooligosaccharide--protein glycosyltransferase subunit KCP2 n=1 Tax=Trichuris muris TaxID=70415 RepID=A0A5S6Q8I9_TRIMR